jgi:hypothetical protein
VKKLKEVLVHQALQTTEEAARKACVTTRKEKEHGAFFAWPRTDQD